MADEDISLTEDQLLENLDDGNNGDAEFLNEVNQKEKKKIQIIHYSEAKFCLILRIGVKSYE